jgi:hypothetical protein
MQVFLIAIQEFPDFPALSANLAAAQVRRKQDWLRESDIFLR